jgi:hypothetical protein
MSRTNRILLTSISVLIALGGAAAFNQAGGPLAPATPEVLGLSGPTWYESQEIGNGITLETNFSFLDTVIDPATNNPARPLTIVTSISYGLSVLDHTVYLDFLPVGDATPYTTGATIDRNLVLRQTPPFAVLNYDVSITPKTGYTWDTVRGTNDMDIVAIQL